MPTRLLMPYFTMSFGFDGCFIYYCRCGGAASRLFIGHFRCHGCLSIASCRGAMISPRRFCLLDFDYGAVMAMVIAFSFLISRHSPRYDGFCVSRFAAVGFHGCARACHFKRWARVGRRRVSHRLMIQGIKTTAICDITESQGLSILLYWQAARCSSARFQMMNYEWRE